MALPRKYLGNDEQVIFHLRTHIKRIIGWLALGVFILAAAVVGTLMLVPLVPETARTAVTISIWVVAVLLIIPVSIVPWLRWVTSTFTITDRRIITRTGILNKKGHDIPLARISNVSYDRSLLDRIWGCGTLILQTSAEVPLHLDDIPRVEQVHVTMTELLFTLDSRQQS